MLILSAHIQRTKYIEYASRSLRVKEKQHFKWSEKRAHGKCFVYGILTRGGRTTNSIACKQHQYHIIISRWICTANDFQIQLIIFFFLWLKTFKCAISHTNLTCKLSHLAALCLSLGYFIYLFHFLLHRIRWIRFSKHQNTVAILPFFLPLCLSIWFLCCVIVLLSTEIVSV